MGAKTRFYKCSIKNSSCNQVWRCRYWFKVETIHNFSILYHYDHNDDWLRWHLGCQLLRKSLYHFGDVSWHSCFHHHSATHKKYRVWPHTQKGDHGGWKKGHRFHVLNWLEMRKIYDWQHLQNCARVFCKLGREKHWLCLWKQSLFQWVNAETSAATSRYYAW